MITPVLDRQTEGRKTDGQTRTDDRRTDGRTSWQ